MNLIENLIDDQKNKKKKPLGDGATRVSLTGVHTVPAHRPPGSLRGEVSL